jgi:Na+-driven multidrug efflux pump
LPGAKDRDATGRAMSQSPSMGLIVGVVFDVGGRVLRATFLPGMAVSFALAPIAGQNVGARKVERIHETFRVGILGACAIVARAAVVTQVGAERTVGAFSHHPAAVASVALQTVLVLIFLRREASRRLAELAITPTAVLQHLA